ncbi:N-acetyltransferase [Nonomuraea phyllanthi]|uniref:N-acetyltransferase n=1 Tax=Nonomuraea phyllanthi TaxID=2219224 RepID=UPI001293BAD5|nr:N-acetyltransferase [Nonomuraea phyllanthi]QFY13480.1 N-acetyltransferase [Nonomuraea phyllanthi]
MPSHLPAAAPVTRPVRTRRDLRQFVELPYELHRGDAAFVPPLRVECRRLLDRGRNPFFAYGEAELFLAHGGDGRVVGRIAAVHNPRHNDVHDARDGFFGQFECVDDPAVARALVEAAAAWLRPRGLTTMMGPVNFTTNDECGLLVHGFDLPPRVLMPYNPPYYPALLEAGGLTKAKDLLAFERDAGPCGERVVRICDVVERRNGLRVRSLDLSDFDAEVARVKRVYHRAWQDNWGFTPMTDAEFAALARRLRRIVDPSLGLLAESGGEPVAVVLALPDLNQALPVAQGRLTRFGLPFGAVRLARAVRRIDHARLVLAGVVEEFRGRGVEAVLFHRLQEAGVAGGYRGVELGWTLEDNEPVNRIIATLGGTHAKTYRIYRRSL